MQVEDSAAGTFTASYDADGALVVQGLPNGLVAETAYNEAGAPVHLSYEKTINCVSECTWLDFDVEESIHGQWLNHTSTTSCEARHRTGSPIPTISMPRCASESACRPTLKAAPRSITTPVALTRPPGSTTARPWSRNIVGIGGELAAIQDSKAGTTLQLANLHGDIVATASLSTEATKPIATFEFDEFGNPKQEADLKFGWLGTKQRRTEFGSTEMNRPSAGT